MGVNVSEIRLLFDPSPPPPDLLFLNFAKASIISLGVKDLFSISLLSSPFVSLTSPLSFTSASFSKCSLNISKDKLQ